MSVGPDPTLSGGLMFGPTGACTSSADCGCGYDGSGGLDAPAMGSADSGTSLCTAPPAGPNPPAPPGSSSANSAALTVVDTGNPGSGVSGITVRCVETGVSYASVCPSRPTFYFTTTGTFHYSTSGGVGTDCNGGAQESFLGKSGSISVPGAIAVALTRG